MIATTIRTPPAATDFIPLAEYQSQTPESFVDGKPVLHLRITGGAASAPKEQVSSGSLAIFPSDSPAATAASGENGADVPAEELVEQQVDVYVTSECVKPIGSSKAGTKLHHRFADTSHCRNFIVFNPKAEAGVSIPYPSISIHAIKQLPSSAPAVWMQLEFSDGGSSDDEFNLVELTIVPPTADAAATDSATASKLYEAIAACSNLHPDPAQEGDDDATEEDNYDRIVFEGSAEHEALEGFSGYFDEDGNWIGPGAEVGGEEEAEELGHGAGRTRARDEVEPQDGVNGHAEEEDAESKRQRVE
ncbi:hypothetical protein LLEC1_07398 [Akanthomyces lecanii]|uniref:Uncharacterized protein n=1 Tax=Cordyceps confragosa TaxID=2714763 RepID=A0A179IAR5_CORDF|nr:hypothetical protein LLEC1_07398 [Akanthomyces lecanii]